MANSDLKISDLDEHAVMGAVPGGIKCGRLPEATIREICRPSSKNSTCCMKENLTTLLRFCSDVIFIIIPNVCLVWRVSKVRQYWYEVVISLLDIEVIFFLVQ